MKFKMIGSGIAALALLATSFSAQAADIPRPVYKGVRSVIAYYNWTGFYAGINAGYGWGTSDWSLGPLATAVSNSPRYSSWAARSARPTRPARSSGASRRPCLVRRERQRQLRPRPDLRNRQPLVRHSARPAGLRFRPLHAIREYGAAFGEVRANVNPGPLFSASDTRVGWTVGAGLEYAFLGNWTAKIEYLYVDLGSFDTSFTAPIRNEVSFKENIVRLGLNYKFSGPIFTHW